MKFSTSSYFGKQKQEEFRQNELKGELDPAIFYKNQMNGTDNSTDKRDGKRLKRGKSLTSKTL